MATRLPAKTKYYTYTAATQLRFSRIINVLVIVQYLRFSLVEFSILQSVFLFSQFASELPSGLLGDLVKKKTVIMTGLIILICSPLLMATMMTTKSHLGFFMLLGVFILEGIGNALLSGADDALFFEAMRNDGTPPTEYAKIRGRVQLAGAIATSVATVLGGVLYQYIKTLPYIFQSGFLLVALVVIGSISEPTNIKTADTSKATNVISTLTVFKRMTHVPTVFFIFILSAFIMATINAVFSILPTYVSDLGYNPTANGVIFMVFSLFGGLMATQTYRLAKYGLRVLCMTVIAVLLVGGVFQVQTNSWLFLIGIALLYIVEDILDPLVMQVLNLWVEDNSRATFISGLSFSITLITMILNPIIGVLVQSFGMITSLVLALMFLIVILTSAYFVMIRPSEQELKR